jgi:uncharacterized protein YjiS (DUF1127 family)
MIALPRPAHLISARRPATGRPGVIALLETWIERHRQRRALYGLDDHMLKDIGLSSADVWREAHKPFWRA